MLTVLILVPLASLLWANTNYIDKYLISKVARNGDYRGLIILGLIVAGIILLPISIVTTRLNVSVDLLSFMYVFFAAVSYTISTILYCKALHQDDTSLVIPMFQLIPVFSYFLGLIFLKEILEAKQIIGGLIIILSAIIMTFEFNNRKFNKNKLIVLMLMTLASLFYAIYFLLFRFATLENPFNKAMFWVQISLLLVCLILFIAFKRYRNSFFELIKLNGKKAVGLNVLNEGLNWAANLIVNFATTLAPLAIVLTLNGLQPFFVFFIGILLSLTMPKIIKEDISKRTLVQKILCIIGTIIGLVILYM